MDAENLKERTKAFAIRVIKLVEGLPDNKSIDIIGRQLLRAGTSVGANYRSACRAKSRADFIAKMGIVEEEADESIYWIELLEDSRKVTPERLESLKREANELVAITVSSINTARNNKK